MKKHAADGLRMLPKNAIASRPAMIQRMRGVRTKCPAKYSARKAT